MKKTSLSTRYNGEMTHRKKQKMNGDITLAALCLSTGRFDDIYDSKAVRQSGTRFNVQSKQIG